MVPVFVLLARRKMLNQTSEMFKYAKVAQLVEHDLAKVGVASSNLVFRSSSLPKWEGFFFA